MFFVKAFWGILFIAIIAGGLFLGFYGVPVIQTPISKALKVS